MRFEDLKYDFPKMPEEMRTMIEREVEKQVKTEQPRFQRRRKAAGKVLAASMAAVVLLGTTTFAGVSIYRMQREQISDHGVNIKISGQEPEAQNRGQGTKDQGQGASKADDASADSVKLSEIPNVKMEIGYLPDGMVQTEEGKYCFEDAMYQGGISVVFYRMDMGDGQFEMLHENVLSSEDLSLNGFDGVYLEYPHLYEEEIAFNQRIYVAFTDVHYVMQMYVASDVSKEEAIKVAESIKLIPVDGAGDHNLVSSWDWSSYLASKLEVEQYNETQDDDMGLTVVSKEDMKNTHAVGERFSLDDMEGQERGLTAKVTGVQVSDDLSLLDESLVDEEWKGETGSDGKLRPATIQYIKEGNKDSLSEVIKSREVAQKLVYVTVDYTNTGDKELKDVLFFGDLARIYEEDGQMKMASGWNYEEPSSEDQWTHAANRGLSRLFEMQYYDVHGGERNNNYIASIQPGETATVHMGWIVTEEELENLYLSLDTYGGSGIFTESALAQGYVDLRLLITP